jgi:Tol biopolymer transport system component
MFPKSRLKVSLLILVLISTPALVAQQATHRSLETITIQTNEGTHLAFDVSPDGRSIVFDQLGQLWLIPASGGVAQPITDAVRDIAEDSDPSFSPDGRAVVFQGERNGRTGLWLLNLDSRTLHQLTQLSNPDGFDGNAAWSLDGRTIAFTRFVVPEPGKRPHSVITLINATGGNAREISIDGLQDVDVHDPVWVRGGNEMAFIATNSKPPRSGRVWLAPSSGGKATPITDDLVKPRAPSPSPDGRSVAYFAADAEGRTQVFSQEIASAGSRKQLTNHLDVTPTRIRWTSNNSLLYSADGRLWKIAASGGQPAEIKFSATLSITRLRRQLPSARFPEPGQKQPARGFMGLALSPDGRRIAILALGKLWITKVGGSSRAVADVPFDATSLTWSPDGEEVAWSSGVADQEDLFATNLRTGAIRRITSLPGRETFPAYSPDGKHLAFVHVQDDGVLRVIDAQGSDIADPAKTQSLGSIGMRWASAPQWSLDSNGLLVTGAPMPDRPTPATFVSLSGQRQKVEHFPDAPIFLRWPRQDTIVFVRHDRLWQAHFDFPTRVSDPQPLGNDAALYASSSQDGTLLFVSDGGLKLRLPGGTQKKLGWPISYTPPVPEPALIRNARILDGTGGPVTDPRDILIEQGRIRLIAPAGSLPTGTAHLLDVGGRVVIPGLMDLHAHTYRPDLLPGFAYFGVTTIRDQGSSMAPLVSYADDIAARKLPGPRVGYGGFQFYSDWSIDEEQGRGIEPEADPEHIKRAVDLAQAFGAQHIKTRTFRRWDLNARMISEAHLRGMRATGHCSHLLPLVAAGMDAKEHIGICEPRGNTYMYDDLIQLFKVARIAVVPTISYLDLAVRLNRRQSLLEDDPELIPFLPAKENFGWMLELTPAQLKNWELDVQHSREVTIKLWRAGVTIGTGTDIWQIPTGVHMELEELVSVGLSPVDAIHAATGVSAQILGADKDLGTIEVGKWADLVVLDADPLVDIRNTRKIWRVMQSGQLIDRPAILKVMRPR